MLAMELCRLTRQGLRQWHNIQMQSLHAELLRFLEPDETAASFLART